MSRLLPVALLARLYLKNYSILYDMTGRYFCQHIVRLTIDQEYKKNRLTEFIHEAGHKNYLSDVDFTFIRISARDKAILLLAIV